MFIAELTSYGQTVVSSQVIIDGIILLYDYIDDISSLSSISSYTQNLDEEACGNINKAIGNVRIYDASSSEYQAKTILFYIKDGNEKKIIAGYSQPTALIQKSGSPLTLFMSFDFSAFTHGFLFSSIQAGYGNASHNTDGIVHIENPDITTDDAFSVYSKLQTDALFEEAIEDATNDSHELIMGTQTASVAAWTGVTKRSALYVGMTINYFLPYAGKANSTLNLTLADGTTSGAIPIYFRGATAVGTHFPVGSLIQLTYLENITIGSTTINAGWFALSNYVDGNTTTYLSAAQPLKAGANGIWGRSLVMRTGADTWESIVLSYKSALAQHVLNTQSGFYTDTIFYNAGTSTVTSGNSSSATMYPVYNTITYTNYFLDTVTTPFVVGKPIYFVGTIHSDGKFYFNSPVYHAQEITTSDIYVFVGLAYSSTTLFLLPYHPMFTLKDGKIVEVTTHSLAIESEIPTNVSDLNNDAGYLTQHQDIKTINNNSLIGTGNVQLDLGDHNVIESISVNNTPQTITNKNVNITVPTNTNQLTNGAGFITSSDIPSNVSAFTNDAGYLTSFTETDPTVPSWAKASTKPTYTASEVGALPDDTFIPSNTTDLTNDAEFITASDIPSNVSAFTNDAGYLTSYTETDPTVPSWAKQTDKPSYTLDEVTDGTTRKLSDYVPTTRKVNNKALSADITLNLDDVADGSSRKLSNYIPYSEILSTINGFDNRRLWQYEIHNTLWAANKRYDVTLTGFNNNNASASLFDGSFETNVVVPKEGTGIILISGKNGSKMWGGGYPYGYLEVAFYYTNIPESVTCRVYSDWQQNPGWHNVTLTNVDKNNNQALYRGVNTGFYGVTQVEITINAKDSVTANVTEVAFYQTRGTLQQMAVFNKTVAQTLYHDLTGTKFIVSGGTQSQFLKADGSLDSNTYATSSQIPTKTSDLTNDSGYITSSALSGYAQTSSLKEGAYVDVDEITMTSSSDNLPTSKAVASYISSLNYATTSQIPTVNNAKLTIQRNGAQIAEFTANASSPVTANIEVPILGIKQNTTTLTPDANKIVTVTVPTTVSELSDSENYELKSNLKEGAYVDVDETTMTSSSDNLPTSKAVASYISGQGFLTQHQSLDGQVASAQYNSTDKTIEFYNASGTKLNTDIDATDFIKDGMVDTVEVTGGNLVITFNTDAGKEDIEIPITDIFNADDYYTKDDIDGFGFLTEHQSLDNCVQKVASTDNAITRFDGTGGTIQNSGVLIDDSNNLLLPLGSSSTFANNAKLAIGNAWFGSNTTGGLAYGTKSGSTYTSYYTFETTAFRPVSGRDNTIDIGTSQYRWKRLYLGTAISNGTYTYSLPSATGTLALTSQIPSNVSALTNDSGYLTSSDLSEGAFVDVDETTTTSTSDNLTTGKAVASYISSLNLATQSQIPTVNNAILTIKKNNDDTGTTFTANADTDVTANLGLHAVASSGSYNDLSNKPTIPTVNNSTITIKKNADDTGDSFTTNAASGKTINLGLHDVATSGDYDDLTNKPDINNATLTIKKNSSDTGTTFTANASQDVTANLGLHDVATSGSYNDLTNKPTIPTVNNATLTIQKNGTTVNTFTANASSPVTANITVPTTVVELSDSSDYVTQTELTEAISTPIIQAGNNISVSYSSSFIPSGYTQVEYITSTGSSYINTNIPPTDTTKVIIDAYTTSTGSFYLFGARATSSSTILFGQSGSATGSVISASVNGTSLQASTNGVAWTRSSTGQRYTIGLETNSGTFTYCVKDHTNSRYFEGTANYTLLGTQTTKIMLCAFNSSNILTGTTRIYQFEIYQNDTLAFKGIPCIRQSDGKYGLYDTVSESFFASVSSTGFSGSDRFVGTVEISAIDNKAVWGNITGTLSNQTDLNTALGLKANSADLATVATSGDYTDLTNTPTNVSTFTNDAGYLTEHQSLSGYVQKVANSTDNAIVRFDGSNSDIQNSLTKVLDDGTVKLPASRSTDAIDRPKFSFDTYWVGSEREGFVFGTEANLTDKKLYSLFLDAFYPLQKSSLGTSNYLWTNLYLGGSIYKNTYQQSLQSKSGTIALTSDIPTNVSSFTNDAGYLTSFTETDPTVPSWAKEQTKPSYTLDEVTDGTTRKLSDYVPTTRTVNSKALSSNITLNLDDVADGTNRSIPTNTNQLTNGAGFITSSDLPTNHVTTDTVQTISATKTISTSSNYATELNGTHVKVYMPTPYQASNTGTKISNKSINVGSDYAKIENDVGRSAGGLASFLTLSVYNHSGNDFSYIDLTKSYIKYYVCSSTDNQVEKFYCDSSSFVHNTDVRPYTNSTSSSTGFDLGTNNYKWKYLYISSGIKNGTYTYSLPSANGTLALTSQIPSVPLESISVDGTTQTITNKNVDLHIPDDIYSSDFICSMTRTNVSGSGNLTLSGTVGPFPVSGTPMPVGTYRIRIRMRSTTSSYSLTVNFGGSYTLTSSDGVIDDIRSVTLSSASTFSASVTQVNANTYIKVSIYEPDVIVTDIGDAAVTNDYNDLDNIPNGTLIIQRNGSNVASFSASATSNVTANITVPTNTNQLTNGAGFITSSDLPTNHVTTDTVQTITALKTFTNGIDLGTYHTSASQSLSTQLTVWDDTTNYQGGIEVTGNFNPATEDEYNLGSSNFPWLNVYANSFVKSGGTSAQFLKADGSVDSNTYLTSSDLPSNHVTTDTAQEITGAKTIAEDKLKIGNTSTNEDIDDYVFKRGQEFIVGTQTSSTSLWKGNTTQPALYEGMCVNYFVPVASTSTTASLELTFPDNTKSGAIPVIRNAGGTVTSSHVGVGAVVQLTLLLNRTIGSTSYEKVWKMNEWYDSNTNTIGYQIRTNNTTMPVSSASGRYRLLFTSADGTKYVPANASTSTSATATKTVTQTPIDPFGRIAYYGSTTVLSENGTPGTSTLYDQYNLTIGYSFTPITLTANTPVYIKCAPQANGSAIIDSTSPMVQSLPSTNDGNIYIFLGIATSTTAIEMFEKHPIYYHDGVSIKLWLGEGYVTKNTAQTITGSKTFTGTLTGTLTGNADSASKLKLLGNNTDESYPVVFAESINSSTSSPASKSIYTDTANSLKYNPSTNTLTTDTFSGSLELLNSGKYIKLTNADFGYTKISPSFTASPNTSNVYIETFDSSNVKVSSLAISSTIVTNSYGYIIPYSGNWYIGNSNNHFYGAYIDNLYVTSNGTLLSTYIAGIQVTNATNLSYSSTAKLTATSSQVTAKTSIIPNTDSTTSSTGYDLGSSSYGWRYVYSNFFLGSPVIPYGTASWDSTNSYWNVSSISPAVNFIHTGMIIAIYFNASNTYSSPKLKLPNITAYSMTRDGGNPIGTAVNTSWAGGATVLFRFISNGWRMISTNSYSASTVSGNTNVIPSSDNSYDLGSTSYKWQNLYITGGNSSHYIVIDNTGGEPTIRPETSNYGYLGTSSYRWYKGYINSLYLKYDINIYLIRINAQATNSSYYQVINRGEDLSVSGTSYYTVNSVKILRMYNSGSTIYGVDPTSGYKDTTSQTAPSNLTGSIRLLTQVYINSTSAANYIALAIIS